MNALDIVLVILLVICAAVGIARGLVRILIGLLSILVAFFLASRYQDPIAAMMTSRHVGEAPARIGAYVLVFLATMIAGGIVAWIVGKLIKLAMLSLPDRLAGGAVGIVAALLVSAFVVHPLVASSPEGSTLVTHSKLAPFVAVVADVGNALAPEAVAKRYERGIESVRRVWRGEATAPLEKAKKAIDAALEKGEKAVEDVKKKAASK